MSAVWHGAARQHLCFRCDSTLEDMVISRRSSSRVVVETIETQRGVN